MTPTLETSPAALNGSTSASALTAAPYAVSQLSPESFAETCLDHLQKGLDHIIQGAEVCHSALKTFPPHSPERRRFFAVLVNAKFLSPEEARGEGQSSKIAKMNLIGANASILRRDEVKQLLPDGYSCAYVAAQLYMEIAKRSDAPFETFVSDMKEANGDLNRQFLEKKLKERKSENSKRPKARDSLSEVAANAQTTSAQASVLADFVYLTPKPADIRRFNEDYASPDALGEAYRVNRLISDTAIGLCVTDTANLHVVVSRIFPLSGLKYVRKFYLLQKPEQADVTTAKIAVIATRTRSQEIPPLENIWDRANYNEGDLAADLSPTAKHKLHVFARGVSQGWNCLVGNSAWEGLPSLKGGV